MTNLKQKLLQQIAAHGPISVAEFMAACLHDAEHGYYATRPALGGADGDFITAPEASQMFGELIGLWCVHEWDVLARPTPFALIELGPGTGALISDAWRAARVRQEFRDGARIHLVETSTPLKAAQAHALREVGAAALWCDELENIAAAPSLIVANEFLDCLPIQQFVRMPDGWRERLICANGGEVRFALARLVLRQPPGVELSRRPGDIYEFAPGLSAWVDTIARRLKAAPGRVLIIDYAGDGEGDTLQAVQAHKKVSPLATPGEADLTARVDFVTLKVLARASGLDVAGPVTQADFLNALGLPARAEALATAHPKRAERIARELSRLTGGDQMGTLFKVLCLSTPNLPKPAGF